MSQSARIDRSQALQAKPVAVPVVHRAPLPGGGQRISVMLEPSKMRRMLLRLPAQIKREFELDALGVEVLELCDGQKTVQYMAEKLAKRHQTDPREMQSAVIQFLRTLIRKGVVQLVIPRRST